MSGISGATRLVGILGWPVEHSLSPRMQNAAFAALALDWAYVPLPAPPERLADALEGLVSLGFVGANVTSPHKHAAARLCAPGGPLSVNTLLVRDGGVEGTSTDAAIRRIRDTGAHPVHSRNPYWDKCGLTFEDPDGYRIVLQNEGWEANPE